MTFVALFRSLNLGHVGSPSSAQLVDAFGGPTAARNFQSNGTVVFDADDPEEAVARATAELRSAGYRQPAVVRTMGQIRNAVKSAPPPDPAETIYRSMISFYDVQQTPDIRLPYRSPDDLVEIRTLGPGCAHSVCWKPRETAGNVTGCLERLLSVPVTTRTVATLQRVIEANPAGIY